MKLRETLLGLLVLALVLGGVWWVRGRRLAEKKPPAAPASATKSGARAVKVVTATETPDVTLADQTADAGGVRLSLSVATRPILAFTKARFRVRADAGGVPMNLSYTHLIFEMTMPMGDHNYRLIPAADGWQEAEVVLPACQSGNRRWYATVEGTAGGLRRSARFQFDLTPASSPPAP
jgi:hypothetical protein